MINVPALHVGDMGAGDQETGGGDVKAGLNKGRFA